MDNAAMASTPFRAIIFDLDGTLIDSVPDITDSVNAVLAEHSRTPLTEDIVHTLVGEGATELMDNAFKLTGDAKARDAVKESVARFLDIYAANPIARTTVYPGAIELLDRLQADGSTLALCTNKPEQTAQPVLAALDLAGYFPVAIYGDTLGTVRKPDPAILTWVLEKLGMTAAEAVMVGDSKTDVATARAVGMKIIVRAGGYTTIPPEELGGDAVIQDFDALWQAMDQLA
jgi:phosphoglycolate phosphatase